MFSVRNFSTYHDVKSSPRIFALSLGTLSLQTVWSIFSLTFQAITVFCQLSANMYHQPCIEISEFDVRCWSIIPTHTLVVLNRAPLVDRISYRKCNYGAFVVDFNNIGVPHLGPLRRPLFFLMPSELSKCHKTLLASSCLRSRELNRNISQQGCKLFLTEWWTKLWNCPMNRGGSDIFFQFSDF